MAKSRSITNLIPYIKFFMKQSGVNPAELAYYLGRTASDGYLIARGGLIPDKVEREVIASFLCIPVDKLFSQLISNSKIRRNTNEESH